MPPTQPKICFGQQPNGFFPKGFFVDKILTARRLYKELDAKMEPHEKNQDNNQTKSRGEHPVLKDHKQKIENNDRSSTGVVWFCHDSDHDYRETITKIKTERYPEGFVRINFHQTSKTKKLFSPLYLKDIKEGWQQETANKLEPIIPKKSWKLFKSIRTNDVSNFCIEMYRGLGLLKNIEVVRSSGPDFRKKTYSLSNKDHFIDIEWNGTIVHARKKTSPPSPSQGGDTRVSPPLEGGARGGPGYFIDHGGNVKNFIPDELIPDKLSPEQLSPTRATRFEWMQSVIKCTHYIYGKSEAEYLDFSKFPDITFIPRDEIYNSDFAITSL